MREVILRFGPTYPNEELRTLLDRYGVSMNDKCAIDVGEERTHYHWGKMWSIDLDEVPKADLPLLEDWANNCVDMTKFRDGITELQWSPNK